MAKSLDDQRKPWHPVRPLIYPSRWLNYTGLQWRQLDKQKRTPPWQTVYYQFRQLKMTGVGEQLLHSLVVAEGKRPDREATPSLLAIDRQTIKSRPFIEEQRGIDANKKMNAGSPLRSQTEHRR